MKIEVGKTYRTSTKEIIEIIFRTNDTFVGHNIKTKKLGYYSEFGTRLFEENGDRFISEYVPPVKRWINIFYDNYQRRCVCSSTMYLSEAEAERYKNENCIKTIMVEVSET